MMKSITLLICLLFITTIGRSQEFSLLKTSPGENTEIQEDNWESFELQDEVMDWREKSVGLFFMPIPLNIKSIDFSFPSNSNKLDIDYDIFSVGLGASFNFDFNASGSGFGNITYFAVIFGTSESGLQAFDIFTAAKYDIKLGDLSKFELSPLLGIGNLSFTDTDQSKNLGNSFYLSGGVRVTWLAAPRLFVGADIQSTPVIFNTESLLGVEGVEIQTGPSTTETATDVKIKYNLPVQVNLSLRYNIF
jgi:hypothetical protein